MKTGGFPRTGPLWLGVFLTLTLLAVFQSPGQEQFLSPGGDHEMHEEMACDQCHQPAAGSVRQQVQANVHHWLGFRNEGASFVTDPVESDDCLACHKMPKNLHPQHRFVHSEYFDLRETLGLHQCMGCHDHHSAVNVVHSMEFCMNCHQVWGDKKDTIEPRHQTLIAEERWDTCLQCHDFHGNHDYEWPTVLTNGYSIDQVQSYLDGKAPAPYGKILNPYLEERETSP